MSHLEHLIERVPEDVLGICRRLRERGKRGWIVGGCVRDILRGDAAKDWDVATDARPDEVVRMFRKVIPTGIQHGTVTVLEHGVPYEVTTLRGEGAYSDGWRPDTVEFVPVDGASHTREWNRDPARYERRLADYLIEVLDLDIDPAAVQVPVRDPGAPARADSIRGQPS